MTNGILVSLGDDEGLREQFARMQGRSSLAEIASEQDRRPALFGMPDRSFFDERDERSQDTLERRRARVEQRSNR